MSARTWGVISAAFAIAGGATAIFLAFYIHSRHSFAVGGNWHVVGIVVSPQRLLAAAGLVMIVGGFVVLRSRVAGGIITAAAPVVGLWLIYEHAYVRMPNLKVWAATIVAALLSSMCAGLAMQKEIEPVSLAEAEAEAVARAVAEGELAPPAGPIETPLA
jgi:hypothetical protein